MTDAPSTENSFTTIMQGLRSGESLADLNAIVKQLIGDVRSINKPGTLTISLKIAPSGQSTLLITDDISVKAPKLAIETTVMFTDDNNNVSRRDPRQPKLPEMERPKPSAELRSFPRAQAVGDTLNVDKSTGEVEL